MDPPRIIRLCFGALSAVRLGVVSWLGRLAARLAEPMTCWPAGWFAAWPAGLNGGFLPGLLACWLLAGLLAG